MLVHEKEKQFELEDHEQQVLGREAAAIIFEESGLLFDELVAAHDRLGTFDFSTCSPDEIADMHVKIEMDKNSLYSVASGLMTAAMVDIEAHLAGQDTRQKRDR